MNRNRSLVLLAVCGVLAAAAGVVGIDDNPPGIALAYVSATALVLAFVHPWKTSKQFRRLIYMSVGGFVAFAVLSNVLEALAPRVSTSGPLGGLLGGAGAAFFLIATLLCPPGLLVGVIGAVAKARREHHSRQDAPVS